MTRGEEVPRGVKLAILVAALGYFVDIYDLILFSFVGKSSLKDMGVAPEHIDATFEGVFNVQMLGMLVGGLVWGVLGDKKGRLSVLFGSILMYSLANVANGFLETTTYYAPLRFVAGVGLAGELGAGVTLVGEIMSRHSRGWGTTIIAGIGVTGALAAGLVDWLFHWRTAYFIGGGMGLLLLLLRVGVHESGMFESVKKDKAISRGNFFKLFTDGSRALRYVAVLLTGVPIWYLVGILAVRAPKIAKDMGLEEPVTGRTAIMLLYAGLAVGDLASGVTSQLLRSRRGAVAVFVGIAAAATAFYFTAGRSSATMMYAACVVAGLGGGYWAVFVTMASEQFGTNLRSTVTTTAPNFVRGSLVFVSMLIAALEPSLGTWKASLAAGVVCLGVALLALLPLRESFGKDLDFVEE
jgi:MFS transporter, putative metabolite:H+ symporter